MHRSNDTGAYARWAGVRALWPLAAALALTVSACHCAAGYPEPDAANDASLADDAMANADAARDASQTLACGNGFADEFETCDPNASTQTPALRCDCTDATPCTLDRCTSGTSAATCDCVCEHPLDPAWFAAVCSDTLPCTLDTVAHYDASSPADPATCDVACTHVLDGNWYAGALATCSAQKPACLAFSSNAFTYDDDQPADPSTCDAACHYTLDTAWLTAACDDGETCTTEAPSFLQDADTIDAAGTCAQGVAYTCNRHDTRTDLELCNGADDDCDGNADDGCPTDVSMCCAAAGTSHGGNGGDAFSVGCPVGSVLVGFDGRAGERVDQITPVCAPIDVQHVAGVPERSYLVRTGTPFTTGSLGGTGGSVFSARCPQHQVVIGMQGNAGARISRIGLTCGSLAIAHVARSWILSVASASTTASFGGGGGGAFTYACPRGTIATGASGRSADEVDQLALVCSTPSIAGTSNITYELVARHSGACADVLDARLDDGAPAIQWPCTHAQNQRWEMQSTNDGHVRFVAAHSQKCLDVTGFSQSAGTAMEQWACSPDGPQRFTVVDVGAGYSRLVAEVSGLCVEVSGGSTQGLAPLVQDTCGAGSTAPEQQWQLVEVR